MSQTEDLLRKLGSVLFRRYYEVLWALVLWRIGGMGATMIRVSSSHLL